MFYSGNGIQKDDIIAHMWWNISAANGNDISAAMRRLIAENMTPSDISKAQAMARKCMNSEYQDCEY